MVGRVQPVKPKQEPVRIPIMMGFRAMANRVFLNPAILIDPCFDHSIEIESKLQSVKELNTRTNATEGIDALPRVALARGIPINTLLENTPPKPRIDFPVSDPKKG
jgi:hypothetical protein